MLIALIINRLFYFCNFKDSPSEFFFIGGCNENNVVKTLCTRCFCGVVGINFGIN